MESFLTWKWYTQRSQPTRQISHLHKITNPLIRKTQGDQTFQTWINNTLSNPKPQEIGVPQGSILSVILIIIKIDKITCLPPEINGSIYLDDFLICYCSKNMATIERKMQQYINKILKWTMKNNFLISCNKTKCLHFCQIHKMYNQSTLKLNGTEIPITHQYKFLDITLDPKLSFISHIKQMQPNYPTPENHSPYRLGCW